jgi:HSP20 family protein
MKAFKLSFVCERRKTMSDSAIEAPQSETREVLCRAKLRAWRSAPAVDVCESERDVVILIDLPGVEPDGVEIELAGNILSVLGKASRDDPEGRLLFSEYHSHDYFRSFVMKETVDTSDVSAALADGVLKITLPKVNKAASRRITISAA